VAELLAASSPERLAALRVFADYELTEQLTVRDIMTERPRTVRAEVPLRDAASEMVRARVGGLLVTDDEERLVGVLSERELLRHLLGVYLLGGTERPRTGSGESRRSVRDVMTRQVLCVSPEQPLAEVASLLANKDVDRVPVVRDGRLVGVLTRGDIVRKLIGY
jgi:CBS domain-containing protein